MSVDYGTALCFVVNAGSNYTPQADFAAVYGSVQYFTATPCTGATSVVVSIDVFRQMAAAVDAYNAGTTGTTSGTTTTTTTSPGPSQDVIDALNLMFGAALAAASVIWAARRVYAALTHKETD